MGEHAAMKTFRAPSSLLFAVILASAPAPVRAADAASGAGPAAPSSFTRLLAVKGVKVTGSAVEYPGGAYRAAHLVDGNPRTEYSSDGKGLGTFVEFDLGAPVPLAAFRHVDRNDPATVGASEILLLDGEGKTVAAVPVEHANVRGGVTLRVLPSPVEARRVRWKVTRLGPQGHGTVGGAEVEFFRSGGRDPAPTGLALSSRLSPIVERKGGGLVQALRLDIDSPYAEPLRAAVNAEGLEPREADLGFGRRAIEFALPLVEAERSLKASVEIQGKTVLESKVALRPTRRFEIHLLPHSHVDIGYTALQADVEKKQDENIETGLRLIRETRGHPEGARFRWNVEVLWPVENYLRKASPEKRDAFVAAVKAGEVGLDAFYGNVLTGLCRPEELVRLMSYATRLSAAWGVPIESAMISDVPGYTWSTVSAMAHAGVRYFSFAPNYFDRMGGTMVEWQNRPFWWKGPDGRSRVLCWCPSRGYALGHIIGDGEALARYLPAYLDELEEKGYPYDLTHLRWNVHGDNGSPDEKVADVVRDWNGRHAWPRLTIKTTAASFREFERRYGDRLPEFAGDYTPYWEDGAASSALETASNRATAERLVQAETLWAIRGPSAFPASEFQDAWRDVLLYSEHTWGAHNSISQPDLPFVLDQWNAKRGFAVDADSRSRKLLDRTFPAPRGGLALPVQVDVHNTASFPRTDLVLSPVGGDRVIDEAGAPAPSQRLSTGALAFLARDVPGFGARRFKVLEGAATGPTPPSAGARAEGNVLRSPDLEVRIDEKTGAIASLRSLRLGGAELVDRKAPVALNDYVYLPGADPKGALRSGPPRIAVREAGPLVASLLIESEAPGCRRLSREVRVIDGLDRVEIIDTVDKKAVRAKEGVHFGFGFDVPGGVVRMDVGLAAVRPELDQIPAACKNWFSVQRWVDISSDSLGVTWATVDAPLVELGGLTANLIGSQTDHRVWIAKLEPTTTIYSWVMNNHWHTNYRAEQEGPVAFRYAIRPHAGWSPAAAARFGIAASQPLIPMLSDDLRIFPATEAPSRPPAPPLRIEAEGVIATALKSSDDGKALILRLFGASGKDERARIAWHDWPSRIYLSDTSERPLRPLVGDPEVPGWGLVTLRVEFGGM
jgi:alpha-mannosidase